MDELDLKILIALENDSRASLKDIAFELEINTSTLYHRLNKLREGNILQKYTIRINPDAIGLKYSCFLVIRLKHIIVGKFDSLFLESFSKFLFSEYEEIIFSSVGNDEQIWCICSAMDEQQFEFFKDNLLKNDCIDAINTIKIGNILKGSKLFHIPSAVNIIKESVEKFDSIRNIDDLRMKSADNFDSDPDREIYF